MVTSAKSCVPTVTDQAAAMQLGQCAKNLATCLAELRTSAQKVQKDYIQFFTSTGKQPSSAGLSCRTDSEGFLLFVALIELVSKWCMYFCCLSSFYRLMKPVAPWRSTLLSQQSRLWGVSCKMPRWRRLTPSWSRCLANQWVIYVAVSRVRWFRPNISIPRCHFSICPRFETLYFSWRSVLKIWAAPQSQWDPPWLSCSHALHKEMNITQVCATSLN